MVGHEERRHLFGKQQHLPVYAAAEQKRFAVGKQA